VTFTGASLSEETAAIILLRVQRSDPCAPCVRCDINLRLSISGFLYGRLSIELKALHRALDLEVVTRGSPRIDRKTAKV
jgi:hypothetical protein